MRYICAHIYEYMLLYVYMYMHSLQHEMYECPFLYDIVQSPGISRDSAFGEVNICTVFTLIVSTAGGGLGNHRIPFCTAFCP